MGGAAAPWASHVSPRYVRPIEGPVARIDRRGWKSERSFSLRSKQLDRHSTASPAGSLWMRFTRRSHPLRPSGRDLCMGVICREHGDAAVMTLTGGRLSDDGDFESLDNRLTAALRSWQWEDRDEP